MDVERMVGFLLFFGGTVGALLAGPLRPQLRLAWERLQPLSPRRRFALALGGAQTRLCRNRFDTLMSDDLPPVARMYLSEAWGVTDAMSALKILRWLEEGGHQETLEQVLQNRDAGGELLNFMKENEAILSERGIRPWDIGRTVQVCRWCVSAGFLTRAQAWGFIDRAAERAILDARSWEDFGIRHKLGYDFWCRIIDENGDPTDLGSMLEWMLKDPASPWRSIPWPPSPGT